VPCIFFSQDVSRDHLPSVSVVCGAHLDSHTPLPTLFLFSCVTCCTASRVSFPRFRRASSELHSCLALLGQFSCTVTRSGAPATYAWGSHHVRTLSRYKSGLCCYHHSSSNGRVPPPHPHSTLHSSAEPSWDLCCLTQAPLDDVQTYLDSLRFLFSRPSHPRCSCPSI